MCHLGSIPAQHGNIWLDHPPHTAPEPRRSPRAMRVSKAPSMTRTTADVARSSGSRGVPRARASPGVPSYSSRRSRFVTNSFPLSLHRSTPRLVVQRIINRWFYTKSTVVYTVSKPTKPGNVRSQSRREGDGPPRLTSRVRRGVGHIYSSNSSLLRSFFVNFLLPPVRANSSRARRSSLLASCRVVGGGVGWGAVSGLRVGKKK